MHCVTLADLAATISQHAASIASPVSIASPGGGFASRSLAGYWACSRTRLELWQRSLGQYRRSQQAGDWVALRRWWNQQTVVLEEVLVSEILTRVLAALGLELDRRLGTEEISPVTHSIHLAHLEARTRVQQVMIDGRGCRVPDAIRLNRLRQGVERWTDVLIGRMPVGAEVLSRYAVELERVEAYAEEARLDGGGAMRETSVWLMNTAMHDMLARRTAPVAALPQANRKLAESVLRMLPSSLFDSLGVIKSSRRRRLETDVVGSERQPSKPIPGPLSTIPSSIASDKPCDARRERWYL